MPSGHHNGKRGRGGRRAPLEVRFWEKVNKDGPVFRDLGPCYLWTASKNNVGRGQIYVGGEIVVEQAHRVAWLLAGRELPKWEEGMVIDHMCRRPLCVNVAHLRIITQLENTTIYADRSKAVERNRATRAANKAARQQRLIA